LTTPESRIKSRINPVLKRHNVYALMPVQHGLGAAGLDYHCVVRVENLPIAFFVEAKDFLKPTTLRQDEFMADREKHQSAPSFVVDDEPTLKRLEQWLIRLEQFGLKAITQTY
jgi:hypothetical protein